MRCPAGVGRWAAGYIQPALPVTDLLETSFDNPFLDHLITILATVLLPVKERGAFVQEHRLKARYVKDGGEEEGDRLWCVLDGEGSEEEDVQVGILGCSFSDQSLQNVSSCAEYNAIACQEAITKTLAPVHKRK